MRKLVSILSWTLPPTLLVAVAIAVYVSRDRWLSLLPEAKESAGAHGHEEADPHAGHDHGSNPNAIVISERGRDNLGLEVGEVEVGEFARRLPIPGEVVEVSGRSDRALTTRVAGVIGEIHVRAGQAVRPGDPLFRIQITGDEVISAQSAMLNAIAQMKVNQAEMDRIKPLIPDSVPEATLLKLGYEQQKLTVQRELHEQELVAHGLTAEQIAQIADGNGILKELTVYAPQALQAVTRNGATSLPTDYPYPAHETVYTMASVEVHPGQLVRPGDMLGRLADHGHLLVRGHAFEKEGDAIEQALQNRWPVGVEFIFGEDRPLTREDLNILYTQNVVASGSRTLEFFLPIENEVVAVREGSDGVPHLSWRFKPGQQARLFVPVRKWQGVIVLPAEAVTEEGPDAFAFTINGKKLERREVRVISRDGRHVAITNDGALFPGEQVALNNAYQLNLALKKQQGGGGADPHAGHMH